MKKFGIPTENMVFMVLLIIYLVALVKTVKGDEVISGGGEKLSTLSPEDNEGNNEGSGGEGSGKGNNEGSGGEGCGEETESGTTSGEGSGTVADEIETTPATMEPTTTEDPLEYVRVGLIYELPATEKFFNEAVKSAQQGSDIKIKVVMRLHANQTDEALKFVTKLCEQMDQLSHLPDIMFDLTRSGIVSEASKLITRILKIPTIATAVGQHVEDIREWSQLSRKQREYLLRIPPPSDTVDQAIRAVSQAQNLSKALILYDDNFEIIHKYYLLKDIPTHHKILNLSWSKKSGFRRVEKEIQKFITKVRATNFMFVGNLSTISKAMSELAEKSSSYESCIFCGDNVNSIFVFSTETGTLSCNECPTTSLILVNPSKVKSNNLDDDFYIDLVEHGIKTVQSMKANQEWKTDTTRISCVNYNVSEMYEDPDMNFLQKFGKYDTRNLYHQSSNGIFAYKFELDIKKVSFSSSTKNPEQQLLGVWKSGLHGNGQLQFRPIALEQNGTKDPQLYHMKPPFKVVTVLTPPYVYWKKGCNVKSQVKKTNNPYAHCYYGYSIDMMDAISKELKANYTIYHVKSYGYMREGRDKKFGGLIGELEDKVADFGIGPITEMPERETVVDFTRHYHPMVGFTFVVKKPTYHENMLTFITVLESDVWWFIIAAYFFTTVLLYIFDRYSPSSYQNNKEQYELENPRIFSLRECLWFTFTSLTPQGGGEAPKGLSGRLVASTWWLFSFIIIASYTANLAAFLTVSRLAKPILSIEDLFSQHRVAYFPVNRSSAYYYYDRLANVEQVLYEKWRDMSLDDTLSEYNRSHLAVWTYPLSDYYTKVWQNFVENVMPSTIEDAVEAVVKGIWQQKKQKFALIGEETDMIYLTKTNCHLKTIGLPFSRRYYAIPVQKGSPLKYDLDKVLAKLEKDRTLEYIYRKWWHHNPHDQRCKRHYEQADGISFVNLGGVFILGGIGIAATFVVVILEVIYMQYWRWKNRCIVKFQEEEEEETTDGRKGKKKLKKRLLRWMFIDNKKTDSSFDKK